MGTEIGETVEDRDRVFQVPGSKFPVVGQTVVSALDLRRAPPGAFVDPTHALEHARTLAMAKRHQNAVLELGTRNSELTPSPLPSV
jgi:hypothetical protein